MEARLYTGPQPDASGAWQGAGVAIGHQRARPLVERRCSAHALGVPQVLVRPYGASFAVGYAAALLVYFMNRRMRNRTSGGVGGRRGKPRLLPDPKSQPRPARW